MRGIFSEQDYDDLSKLEARAKKANMTPYAFAVHTGEARLIKLMSTWQAMTDYNHCMETYARHADLWGRTFTRHSANPQATKRR